LPFINHLSGFSKNPRLSFPNASIGNLPLNGYDDDNYRYPIEAFGNDKRVVLEKSSCFCPSSCEEGTKFLTKQSSLLQKKTGFYL
jgi:hypothetical protein